MTQTKSSIIRKCFSLALVKSLPILAGFCVAGISYGMYAKSQGFNFIYPAAMSALIYGGSLEFVAISMLGSPFAPLTVFLTALMIQARHFFYGISLHEKYQNTKPFKPYLIYALCDETFSINCSQDFTPATTQKERNYFYFFVTLLNQIYWIFFSSLGAFLGEYIKFDLRGLDFVMTALFTVILVEMMQKNNGLKPALIGLTSAALCRILIGPTMFLIPSMILILLALAFYRKITRNVK